MKKLKLYIISYDTPEKTDKLYNQLMEFNVDKFDLEILHNGLEHNAPESPHTQMERNFGYDYLIAQKLKEHKKENAYEGYWFLNQDIEFSITGNTGAVDYVDYIINLINTEPNIQVYHPDVAEYGGHILFNPVYYSKDLYTQLYTDMQAPLFTSAFLDNYDYLDDAKYFHGGLDLDVAYYCMSNNIKIGILRKIEMLHSGPGTDHRNPKNKYIYTRPSVELEARKHAKILGLGNGMLNESTPPSDGMTVNLISCYGLYEHYGMPYMYYNNFFTSFLKIIREYAATSYDHNDLGDRILFAKEFLVGKWHIDEGVIWFFEQILSDFDIKSNAINFIVGRAYYNIEKFEEAIPYLENIDVNSKESYLDIIGVPLTEKFDLLSMCYYNTGDMDKAYTNSKSALNHSYTDRMWENFNYFLNENWPANSMQVLGESVSPVKKKICFVVPIGAPTNWGPSRLEDGLGGSENVTINLTEYLGKEGHTVMVYTNTNEEGLSKNGVTWAHIDKYAEFDKGNTWDLVVVSRRPYPGLHKNYSKLVFWPHDLNITDSFNKDNYKAYDAFLPLTSWHAKYFKALHPFIPDDLIYQFQNGIDLNNFDVEVKRNKNKLIYTAAPERGLEYLLEIFEVAQRIRPELELHIFSYKGRESFSNYKINSPGVVFRGTVGQKELAKEFKSSYLWVYPCRFLETFCISAVEAQAAGTPAISSDNGLMPEIIGDAGRIVVGSPADKVSQSDYIDALFEILDDDEMWERCHKAGLDQAKKFSYPITGQKLLNLV